MWLHSAPAMHQCLQRLRHLAEKYASDAMDLLERAKTGASTLYFYER